jgi:hypothetical protein
MWLPIELQPFGGQVKNFFGFFNLTKFEVKLIEYLIHHANSEDKKVLLDQFNRFNFVNRVIKSDDERLKHGFTDFYSKKLGRLNRFPVLLAGLENVSEYKLLGCKVCDSTGNVIEVNFFSVNGVFFELEFFSSKRVWYPVGEYSIIETVSYRSQNI